MTRLYTLTAAGAAHTHAPKPGEVLGGKYRIEREIGSGGMGIVYEVTHLVMTKKRFAVKWLLPLPEGYDREDARIAARRFVREAEIAGGICHPNVVQVFDVTVGDDDCFMVMELLEGESLETRLKRDGRLPPLEAVRILIACASGLGAAHAANVIHRDLKPANIFLTQAPGTDRPHPKLLDFGISRFTAPDGAAQSTVTRAGTLIGTPMYMAPEQLRGFECDARTDVYGLGVTLYEALSGRPAYFAQTHADLVVHILTGDAQELRLREPTISIELSAIVMKAMHHDPDKRFPSVQAFADALRAFVDVASRPPPPATTALAPPRKSKLGWVVVLAGCALVLGLGLLAWRWSSETSPAAVVKPAPPAVVEAPDVPNDPLPEGALPQPHVEMLQPPAAASPAAASEPVAPEPNAATSGKRRAAKVAPPAPTRPAEPAKPQRAPKPRPALKSL
ncbi:MAG TPA: protein kinase [Polyangiales bacterium]|nr:protein kinase [Polyangiales bacterium]